MYQWPLLISSVGGLVWTNYRVVLYLQSTLFLIRVIFCANQPFSKSTLKNVRKEVWRAQEQKWESNPSRRSWIVKYGRAVLCRYTLMMMMVMRMTTIVMKGDWPFLISKSPSMMVVSALLVVLVVLLATVVAFPTANSHSHIPNYWNNVGGNVTLFNSHHKNTI